MKFTPANLTAGAIMALTASLVSLINLFGIAHWTTDQIAGVNLLVTNVVVVAGLLFASTPVSNTPPGP